MGGAGAGGRQVELFGFGQLAGDVVRLDFGQMFDSVHAAPFVEPAHQVQCVPSGALAPAQTRQLRCVSHNFSPWFAEDVDSATSADRTRIASIIPAIAVILRFWAV
eukprot:SAG31_NODE_3501_length_4192_cov_1.943562_2_plen_106_part_00